MARDNACEAKETEAWWEIGIYPSGVFSENLIEVKLKYSFIDSQ